MPTVAELAHDSACLSLAVADGCAGLSREICRVERLSPDRLDTSLHSGDLVLMSVADWSDLRSPSATHLIAHLGTLPVAAAVVTGAHRETAIHDAGTHGTPLLIEQNDLPLDQIHHRVERWLDQRKLAEEQMAHALNEDLADLVRAGADVGDLVAALMQLTGKPALVHDPKGRVRYMHQPGGGCVSRRELRAAVAARATADSEGKAGLHAQGVCAVELAALGLTRLTVALDGRILGGDCVSLVGRPAEITQRDRAAVAAAARALSHASARVDRVSASANVDRLPRSLFAVAIDRPSNAGLDSLRLRFGELLRPREGRVSLDNGWLIGVVPAGQPAMPDWARRDLVQSWYAALSAEFGPISLGYSALHSGPHGLHGGELRARQALVVGERLSGCGRAHAYSDVCLQRFLVRAHDPAELRALQEMLLGPLIAHDGVDQDKLLPTLEVYLDSACVVKHAADRLQIHRNSVVYRLRQIESLAQVDLGDAGTRLLLQLALHARRATARV